MYSLALTENNIETRYPFNLPICYISFTFVPFLVYLLSEIALSLSLTLELRLQKSRKLYNIEVIGGSPILWQKIPQFSGHNAGKFDSNLQPVCGIIND